MKIKLLIPLLFLLVGKAYAGEQDSTIRWQPSGVGLHAGITGVGAQLAWKLSSRPRLVLRVGVTYVGYKQKLELDIGQGSKIDFYPDVVIGIAQTSVKWHPFRRGSFF